MAESETVIYSDNVPGWHLLQARRPRDRHHIQPTQRDSGSLFWWFSQLLGNYGWKAFQTNGMHSTVVTVMGTTISALCYALILRKLIVMKHQLWVLRIVGNHELSTQSKVGEKISVSIFLGVSGSSTANGCSAWSDSCCSCRCVQWPPTTSSSPSPLRAMLEF